MAIRSFCLILLLLATLPSCRSFDDSRVLQVLNQRGFGRKYVGDANEILTIGIGDTFSVADLNNPDILGTYTVRLDGVVTVPMVGEVFVAGFSTDEIGQALNIRYKSIFKEPDVMVTVISVTSKRYFIHGETTNLGEQPLIRDTTVWDAVMSSGIKITADLSDIYVIRSDPQHPLVVPVDLEKMMNYGDSSDNILLREDDIVIVRPNFAGWMKRGIETLLAPIQPLTQLAVSVRNIDTIYKSFGTDDNFFVGGRGSNYGGGYGGGYGYGGSGGGTDPYSEQNPIVDPPGGSSGSN